MFFCEVFMVKICIIGIGYIGLPTACILSNEGFHVVGVDINEDYINNILSNNFKSNEKYLIDMMERSLKNKNLILKLNPEKAEVFIISIPTPLDDKNNPDLSCLEDAIASIIPYLDKGNILIIESTIPPNTTNSFIKPMIESSELKVGEDIYLAHCPERVIPGNIIFELINNSRIVGGSTERCSQAVEKFYKQFIKGEIITSSAEIAEMVKLVENSYRDVNIAFSNEITMICNQLLIDPYKVIGLANKHPRVDLLSPGIGVGGHCLPVDPYFIIKASPNNSKLIQNARSINDKIPEYITARLENLLRPISNATIGVWGVTYKGDSEDTRNSPAMEIINVLKSKNYKLKLYDPLIQGMSSLCF